MPPAFRALASPNFRIFLTGQGIGLVGTWSQRIAMLWLVYRTTDSPLLLGAAAFAAEIPLLLISPFGGIIADRVDRRRALMAVQVISALQAFVLGALAWAGLTAYPVLLVLAVILGICQAVEAPLRQAMFPELLRDPHELPNAIALMAFMNNAGRLIGPTVAGFIIGAVGEKACFLFNGFGYLLVLAALARLSLPHREPRHAPGSVLADLREGVHYAWEFRPIRWTLALLATVGFCGLPYLVVMPVFTREVLQAGPQELGFLLGAAGTGGVFALVLLATRGNVPALPRLLSIGGLTAAVSMLALSQMTSFWPAFATMACMGFGIVVTATSANILIQSVTPADRRGRVLGFYSMLFLGIAPVGSFAAGTLTEAIGSRACFGVLGAALAVGAIMFARRRKRLAAHIAK
jgi:MFS family permease